MRQEVKQDLVGAGVECRHSLLTVGLTFLKGLENIKIKVMFSIMITILLCHFNVAYYERMLNMNNTGM